MGSKSFYKAVRSQLLNRRSIESVAAMSDDDPQCSNHLDWSSRVRQVAKRVRDAICRILPCDLAPELSNFPRAACGSTVLILNAVIEHELGSSGQYVAGVRSTDEQSHAWLELDDLIIDLTANQFSDVTESVIVTRDREWHDQFREITRPSARLMEYDPETRERFEKLLQRIRAFL